MNERLGIWSNTQSEDGRPRYTTELILIPNDRRLPVIENQWTIEEGENGETLISNHMDGVLEWRGRAMDRSIYQQIQLMDKVFFEDSEVVPSIMWFISRGAY